MSDQPPPVPPVPPESPASPAPLGARRVRGRRGGGDTVAVGLLAVILTCLAIGFWSVEVMDGGGGGAGGADDDGGGRTGIEATELFTIPAADADAPGGQTELNGAWVTDKVFVKGTHLGMLGVDAATGRKAWPDLTFDGPLCGVTPRTTEAGITAVIFQETRSRRAACNQIAAVDLNTGKIRWQERLPDSEDAIPAGTSLTISDGVVAARWGGGAAAYRLSGDGDRLWSKNHTAGCHDQSFAGGPALVAVVRCDGSSRRGELKVRRIEPESARLLAEYPVPDGLDQVTVVSTRPLALLVATERGGDYSDLLVLSGDARVTAKIPFPADRYEPGCEQWRMQRESCAGLVFGGSGEPSGSGRTGGSDTDTVYVRSALRDPGGTASGNGRTNEILALDLATGKQKWKSDAGTGRTLTTVHTDGRELIGYRLPDYNRGPGEVVTIDPGSGKQKVRMRLPEDGVQTSASLTGPMPSAPVLFAHGRLYLHRGDVPTGGSTAQPIAGGYGIE